MSQKVDLSHGMKFCKHQEFYLAITVKQSSSHHFMDQYWAVRVGFYTKENVETR